jgi:sugar/nucleoside kinase (ribokinase family)
MSVLIVGSVALDTIEANGTTMKDSLGGSAMYASMSASYFTKPSVVAVVGNDFPSKYIHLLNKHNIDTSAIAISAGKTFRWHGKYSCDLNQAKTLNTKLNVFAQFNPTLSKEQKNIKYLFLANVDPDIQKKILDVMIKPKFVALDTMNFWIDTKLKELKTILKKIDLLLINEDEATQLSKQHNIIKAAKFIQKLGPEYVVIKRGKSGATLFYKNEIFSTISFPLENVVDTTGAGDTFAGGFMGYLAGINKTDFNSLKKAVIYGTIMSSFNVESFSLKKLSSLTKQDIQKRLKQFKEIMKF